MALIPYEKTKDVWEEVKDRIRHEPLPDLLGGNDSGHYHLTLDELEALHDVPEDIREAVDSVRHEKLPDLQGGKSGEHYHLTYDELEHLHGLSEEIEDAVDGVRHEELPDLLGGSSDGHYHLTPSELAQLRGIRDTIATAVNGVRHEDLPDLLGGSDAGHYHLTEEERTKLRNTPATISIGEVRTGAAGTDASVIMSGTATEAILNFIIPKGDRGDDGQNGLNGKDGKAATVSVGMVTTGKAGSSVFVTNSGTDIDAVLNFTIPCGATGATGATGAKGADGKTPTISIGSVRTVAADESANVTTSTTTSGVALNFEIPKGERGAGADITVSNYTAISLPNITGAVSDAKNVLSTFTGRLLYERILAVDEARKLTVSNYTTITLPSIKSAVSSDKNVLSTFTGRLLYEKILEVEKNASSPTLNTETWTFTLLNGTTVTKKVAIG